MPEEVVEVEESEFQPTPLEDMFMPSAISEATPDVVEPAKTEESETKTDVKSETEAEVNPEPNPEPVKPNWEDETNPYKGLTNRLESQYKNTRDWATKAYKLVKEYGLTEIEEPDFAKEQVNDESSRIFAFRERETASRQAASEIYGEDFVNKTVYAVDSPFSKVIQANPELYQRVFVSKVPALEAIKIVKEQTFFGKYGGDVEKIPEKIKKELETELRAKITKELQGKLTQKEKLPNTLSGVHSKDVVGNTQFAPTPITQLFG